jgi:hypothetical protein
MARRRPLCNGSEPTTAQRGCRQPTIRVLDQAAGIGPGSMPMHHPESRCSSTLFGSIQHRLGTEFSLLHPVVQGVLPGPRKSQQQGTVAPALQIAHSAQGGSGGILTPRPSGITL